ncbi:cytochrome aa3 quinol oxidase subunit II [Paenibacillus aquistagni]|uniref:cytochrome aa3 quinol oxidase subunit II n=1 Tax=Paenibacillus aquistagni TaxID=1852522 RepID=UPI00145B306E|nr:cytochrome aa3 quinol oxidase subunit II [Paenibacillus aquistagni]NMM52415.1 cytochrome aa3 quinol oxidase subunit II [Paenibacillus aquistagni]
MKRKGLLLALMSTLLLLLTGCEPLLVLNPKGPQAQTQANTIIFSIIVMAFVLLVVYVLFVVFLSKYRASKLPDDYEPPYEKGNKWLEIIWIAIPVLIVAVLSVVTVKTTNAVEKVPVGYENQKPLVIYAASSNWKWHFSYPEENIETVNYVNIPTNRPVEFRMYSYGPITSFWIPQLGGQKYAMSDMVTKLHFVAEHEASMMGRNSNFSGEGYAHMEFEVLSMSPKKFDEWVNDVKANEAEITEDEFDKLLATPHVGRKSYTGTHLTFSPAPEGEHAGHNHGSDSTSDDMDHSDMDHEDMDHSNMDHSEPSESEHSNHE